MIPMFGHVVLWFYELAGDTQVFTILTENIVFAVVRNSVTGKTLTISPLLLSGH